MDVGGDEDENDDDWSNYPMVKTMERIGGRLISLRSETIEDLVIMALSTMGWRGLLWISLLMVKSVLEEGEVDGGEW